MGVLQGLLCLARSATGLRQNVMHNIPMDVGQAVIAALESIGQTFMIDSQAVQNRGMKVMDMNGILFDVVAEIIRLSVFDSRLNPTPGHPQ